MLNHLMSTRTLSVAVFAVAAAMLTAVVSVPAGAKDKPLMSKSELKNLVANAETKADHERIAQYFDTEATKYEAEAKEHGDLAPYYQKTPEPTASKHPNSQRSFAHCDALSKSLQQAAENARQLAADHREMGKEAK
jgi:hypothetical protein